jgi:integrase
MASITKEEDGWHAFVCVDGKRRSKRFPGKNQAADWANRIERQLRDGDEAETGHSHTLADAMERYEREVTPTKKGARWEAVRLKLLLRDRALVDIKLSKLSSADLAAWRDRRLKEVSGSSVAREMNLIGHVLTIARKEWRWISQSPMTDVRRPKEAPPRERRVSEGEIELIKVATGYRTDIEPKAVFARVGAAFLFAIETAMRCGEICGLQWKDVDFKTRVATLYDTKNGWKREVALSRAAIAILEQLRIVRGGKNPIFGLNSEGTSVLFRKARIAAGIDDLTFHDSRHEAITRLAPKMDVLALARMVGHRDIRMLMIYYNKSAADIALEL